MARAAVIPQSPARRVARTSTKSTAAADAKKKAPRKPIAPRTAPPALDAESDDELGFIISKPAKPSARPPGRPATKPRVNASVPARGKKASTDSLADRPNPQNNAGKDEPGQETEIPKKRVGRPRKNPLPTEVVTTKPETTPKTRGRPRAGTTATGPQIREATATSRRTRAAVDTANGMKQNQIRIATNSTTIRSNLLRGPAKKKTVKFQDVSDSEAEDSVPEVPAVGRRQAATVATKGAGVGKAGLRATPVRKPATTGTRGRKPVAAKKDATKPLSPKKAKQVAKSLSAYASSDGEEDELNTIKNDFKDPLRLVVHSPVKHGLENTGLSSPVRRINFTPKKVSSFVDENGEPKLPTPKHGSDGIGLSSPVRKINFAPNRSQNTVADNGHLALPPGNSIDFSDSMFMSSPARRPAPSSPFQFSMRDTPNRGGSLFQDSVNPISAPDFTPGRTSPLKMSPKKAHLGASFSQSPFKASTSAAPARTPLFQSPAKRIASPFKNSISSAHASVAFCKPVENDGTPSKTMELAQSTTPKSSPSESHLDETAFERDTEMVEDVARDIFGIELASSISPIQKDVAPSEVPQESSNDGDSLPAEVEDERNSDQEEDESEYIQDKTQPEYEEPETICFDAMEEANMPTEDLYDEEPREDSGSRDSEQLEHQAQFEPEEADTICFDAMEDAQLVGQDHHDQEPQEESDLEEHDDLHDENRFEYEELDTICFDAMEDAQLAGQDLHDQQSQEDSDLEEGEYFHDKNEFEYEEFDTICFDAMEDAHLAENDLYDEEDRAADSVMEETEYSEEELAVLESEAEKEEPQNFATEFQFHVLTPEPLQTTEMQEQDMEEQPNEIASPSSSLLNLTHGDEAQPTVDMEYPLESEHRGHGEAIYHPEEEEQVMSEESEVEDTESILDGSAFEKISSETPSSYDSNHLEDIATPLKRKQAIPLPQPSSTGGKSTPLSLNRPDNSENDHDSTLDAKNATIDPLHEENSWSPSTQLDSPALMAPSLFNTPSVIDQHQHQSPVETSLGFTPLAQKFGRWEQNTPSQARSLRPRRRGVFSLVGPLDRTSTEAPTNSHSVSYPDLPKSPVADTPSLFAELPLQPQSNDTSMSPEYEQTPQPSSIYEDYQIIDPPHPSTDIFEDPDLGIIEPEVSSAAQAPQDQGQGFHILDDKENCGPLNFPSTPMKAIVQPDELRTIHTVSKVPLKAEGEVSPLKLSRKRGLSFSSTSPTRSSPRIRKSTFMALNDSVPILSPSRKSPRVSRSPTPKRRSIVARRSSVKAPVMAALSTPVATASPAKKPRRSIGTEQKALNGAVVHVDVHTTEGEDASGIFVELLQQMGARCVKSWSWNPRSSLSPDDGAEPKDLRVGITHVVYKDGGLRTMEKVKKAAGLVKCVGVSWVLDCERENQWLDETPYAVDSSIIPRGGAKRRKSMEPRALTNVNGTLVRISESPALSAGRRRSGVNPGAVEGFRKITPPTHQQQMPSTPPKQSSADNYQFPATPGYNFANLDAIGMSPATPAFLGNRSKLVQQSCPPKQSNRGLFPSAKPASILLDDGQDEESRRQRRFRMEAARRKSLVYKPAVGSPLVP